MPIAAPRRMTNNDVSNTPKLSGGGGGPQSVPSRISVVLVDEANAGGTPGRECSCEDQYMRPLAGTTKHMMAALDRRARGGRCSLPMLPGGSFRLMLRIHQRCLLGDLGRSPSRISVVLVDGTKAGGTPGRECPREDRDLRPLAGVTRPAGVSMCGGSVGSPCVGGGDVVLPRCCWEAPSWRAYWGIPPVGPMNPVGPDGPVVAGGPVRTFWNR